MRIRAHGSTVANGAADLEARLHAQAATQAQDGTGRSRTNCNSTHSVARIHAQAQECAVAAPIVREHILQHGSTPKHRKAPSRHQLKENTFCSTVPRPSTGRRRRGTTCCTPVKAHLPGLCLLSWRRRLLWWLTSSLDLLAYTT